MRRFLTLLIGCTALSACATTAPRPELIALDTALSRLASDRAFSGAVVIRDGRGTRFAKGYGWADPFARRPFTPATPVDSASLAKPVTAAAVLLLASEARVDLDAPVTDYLAEFPHPATTVRQLLAHSAGLPGYDRLEPLAGKSNADFVTEIGRRGMTPAFPPGTAFSYCNTCYDSLALLVERVTGQPYIEFVRQRVGIPPDVRVRPQSLTGWHGRAVGFRSADGGVVELADSAEGEAFFGSANLSITATALAEWGVQWWSSIAPLRKLATSPVRIGGGTSGLTLGNWYCAPTRTRCHYLGHHEGFHHMLYWDAERRLSIAMVTNNALAPDLQQRLQRAIVAFATAETARGRAELARRMVGHPAVPGDYRTQAGEVITLSPGAGPVLRLSRGRVGYDVFPIGDQIGYAPGLDLFVTGSQGDSLHLLSLYEDQEASPLGVGERQRLNAIPPF